MQPVMRWMRMLLALAVVLSTVPMKALAAGMEEESFFTEIPSVMGTLARIQEDRAPVSVTTITSDMIAVTPARNIFDLIEIYVPGAIHLSTYDSEILGMRGIVGNRNNHLLLLVNGHVMEQTHSGIVTELQNWDMNDIDKIEITRGPGSVTYGAGAEAGVISITTKNAMTGDGLRAGVQGATQYRTGGGYASYGHAGDKLSQYTYFSDRQTQGVYNPKITLISGAGPFTRGSGVIGENNGTANWTNYSPKTYYADTRGLPQTKFHTQWTFHRDWTVWARYTNNGYNAMQAFLSPVTLGKTSSPQQGTHNNFYDSSQKQYTISVENNHKFSGGSDLKTTLAWDSINSTRINRWDATPALDPWSDPLYVYNFSQNRLDFRSVFNITFKDRFNTAVGLEDEYEQFGRPWGDKSGDFLMDDGTRFVGSSTNGFGLAPNGTSIVNVGPNGFDSNTLSVFGEENAELTRNFSVIASARLDQNKYASPLLNPRLALVYNQEKLGVFKVVAQKSSRMNTAIARYSAHLQGNRSTPEYVKDAELMYDSVPVHNFRFHPALFYTDMGVVSWIGPNLPTIPVGYSQRVGNLRLWGAELEVKYETPKVTAGASHSYVKQLGWNLAAGVPTSFISPSDGIQGFPNNQFAPTGNNLLNWANHSTKAFVSVKPLDKLTIFGDCRVFWQFEGGKDLLRAYRNANLSGSIAGAVNTNTVTSGQIVSDAESKHIFDTNAQIDLSARYQLFKPLSIMIYGMNLIKIAHNYRYSEFQNVVIAVKEPVSYGFSVDYKFGGKAQ